MRTEDGGTTVTVTGFTHGGEGVARIDGKAVFVPGALPGEQVRVRVVDDRRRWSRAELLEVVSASDHRVVPPCPFVPDCGGCDLQHVSPGGQRALKTRVVTEQLQRLAKVPRPPVEPCRDIGADTGYRTQARMHAADDGRLGFLRAGSDEVVPIDTCLVLTEAARGLRTAVGDATGAASVRLRALGPGTAAAVLTPGPGPLQLPDGEFDLLLEQPDGDTVALRGDGLQSVEVGGLRFGVPAGAFFQSGPAAAGALLTTVLDVVGDVTGALTWDLYAGVGLLALPLARAGAEVVAVEGHAGAAAAAADNAAANGLAVRVLAEPVAAVLGRANRGDTDLEAPEVVVLDPPRSGAGRAVVDALAALTPPSVVYVACDVAALARDTRRLVDHGYRLARVVPLDLFPMTHHVEVVAAFTR